MTWASSMMFSRVLACLWVFFPFLKPSCAVDRHWWYSEWSVSAIAKSPVHSLERVLVMEMGL